MKNPRESWNPVIGGGRVASLLRFVLALGWYELAKSISASSARGLTLLTGGEDLFGLVHACLFLFLLLLGYGFMGKAFDRQPAPMQSMGLEPRPGWQREFGVGAAVAWGGALVVVLVIAVAAWLRVEFWTEPRAWWLLGINVALLLVTSLAEEVAFRGYPFQRLIEAVGPVFATVTMACIFAAIQLAALDGSGAGAIVAILTTVLFSLAYLRTRGLWLPWGAHFAWKASLGILFGLPLEGTLNSATVVQSRALGARWLTGGSYGPEGSAITVLALFGAIVALIFATRDYAWQYTQPVIVAGGMAVDVAPPAAHTAMEAKAAPLAGTTLVQIAGVSAPPKQTQD